MALKVLMMRKRLDGLRSQLTKLREKDEEFKTREAELATAIDETETDEQRSAVDEMVTAFEQEREAHENEETALEDEIRQLESELETAEAAQNTEPPAQGATPAPDAERKDGGVFTMNKRNIFNRMSIQERDAFFGREDVKKFLGEVRTCIQEKRALTNIGVTIPVAMLPMLKEKTEEASKLLKYVNVQAIAGEGRLPVMGTVPEAIWTECCAALNEMDLSFSDAEVDCYKVGGYFAICNANIEDSDYDLAGILVEAIGKGIGMALDKAILFGRNTSDNMKMPLGIATRLLQQSKPDSYPATARPWVDLHSSNVKTIANSVTGVALVKAIILNGAAAVNKYTNSAMVWVMNKATKTKILGESIGVNSEGQIVAGVANQMPVVGGDIVELECVPDNMIVAGYFDLYLLGERAGNKFASSEHVRFLNDQTVFKGTARYDGLPVIAEGFVFIGIESTSPAISGVVFGADTANAPAIALNANEAAITVGQKLQLFAMIKPGMGPITWASGTAAKATVDSTGVVTGVASGSSKITATCDGLTASCTVTVTSE